MTTPQTFAISVPHSSSVLGLGRCACPDGASLTTVGSVLADAAGTLTAQCDGGFLAQTNAAMSWLSQAGTQVHTAAGMQVYAGGGTAPGACGLGAPAGSPGESKPGESTEKAVNAALAAASLVRNAVDGAAADNKLGKASQGLDALKNAGEFSEAVGGPGGSKAPYAEAASGVAGVAAAVATGDLAGGLGGLATIAAGVAGASGAGSDLEQRAVNEIKMVAGTMITGSAGVGFEYKTLNKFSVTAGGLTSFTTTGWGAFCLLKFEVKAGFAVQARAKVVDVTAKSSATMDAKATLTFESPRIDYESKLKVTKTLTVDGKTKVNSLEVKNGKKSTLDGNLTVDKNMVVQMNLTVEKNLDAKKTVTVTKEATVSGSARVAGSVKMA